MGLVENNNRMPATHAMIIGVDDYPHLQGGVNADAAVLSTLKQLTSSVPSATLFANWLLDNKASLVAPLGSVRVLLTGGKFSKTDGTVEDVDTPTAANIARHFDEWFLACNSDKNCVAIFYYSGHGIMKESSYLLPEDACSSIMRPWENCIDFNATHLGMQRCRAETQFFFVDACQDLSRQALLSPNPFGRALISRDLTVTPKRDAPVYFSAAPGQRASALKNQPSDFTVAVLECLTRYGASPNLGRNPWRVTSSSLKEALGELLDRKNQSQAPPLATNLESTTAGTKRICYISNPRVLTNLELGDDEPNVHSCSFKNADTGVEQSVSPPFREVFDTGKYNVNLQLKDDRVRSRENEELLPPMYVVTLTDG